MAEPNYPGPRSTEAGFPPPRPEPGGYAQPTPGHGPEPTAYPEQAPGYGAQPMADPARTPGYGPEPTAYRHQAEASPGFLAARRSNRQDRSRARARAREARWANNRLAVPYPTDGPKITFGVLWFLALVGAVVLGEYVESSAVAAVAVAAVAAPVAGLAGLQTGHAWFPRQGATRSWTAAAAYLCAVAGLGGPWGVAIGILLGLIALLLYLMLYRGHSRTSSQLFDVLLRSAIPVGVAVASLAALGTVGTGAQISLILLVSAYESGDFIVGSGSSNAIEGPLAGLVALGAVAFILFLVQPAPFDSTTILLFATVAGICCPIGQIVASGLLPRGNAWAPALRRLDSYLLAAPIWLVLALQVPNLN